MGNSIRFNSIQCSSTPFKQAGRHSSLVFRARVEYRIGFSSLLSAAHSCRDAHRLRISICAIPWRLDWRFDWGLCHRLVGPMVVHGHDCELSSFPRVVSPFRPASSYYYSFNRWRLLPRLQLWLLPSPRRSLVSCIASSSLTRNTKQHLRAHSTDMRRELTKAVVGRTTQHTLKCSAAALKNIKYVGCGQPHSNNSFRSWPRTLLESSAWRRR